MNLGILKDMPIALLLGGDSAEREISLMSGSAVGEALRALGAQVTEIDTATEGWWQRLPGLELAFICLHGPGGEDGVVQGMLETLGVAYTGSGVLASALAMDKLCSKRLWRGIGLPTADFVELNADSQWQDILAQWGRCFVKPATGGSSIATGAADTADALRALWIEASKHDSRVVAERLIDGPEYTVAMLGGKALPAIKMETDNAFYDYQAKYFSDDTRYLCPCGLAASAEAELASLALQAFESLGCTIWGRVDFMRDSDGEFYLLEVNTVPGMTNHSLVPMAAQAEGIDFETLVGRIACLSLAQERGRG